MTIDIHALQRADIAKRDWGSVHIDGDRNPPITLGPRRIEPGTVSGAVPRFFRRGRLEAA